MRLRWLGSIILLLVILMPSLYTVGAQPESTDTSLNSAEIYESKELMVDPILAMEPDYTIQGLSEEFSFEYESSSPENRGGVATLNWTHVAGTELAYDTSYVIPQCQEFVYFSQDFVWDLDSLPSSLNLSLIYQITRTDNFLTQYSTGLFEVSAWFIHPDGIWQQITTFSDQDIYRMDSHTISRIYFNDLFEKLATGNQESLPAAKLAIGLVPTWRFQDNNGVQLWRTFNGSIIVDITEMRLSALHRQSAKKVEIENPTFNNSWVVGSPDSFRDSFMSSDDSLYVLTVEDYGSTVTRVGLRGEEIWRKTWSASERMLMHSIAATPQIIYIIGTIYGPGVRSNVGLYALDINSNPLWDVTLNYSSSDYPGDVGVNSEGEIFIGVSTALSPARNILIKLDSNGEILWEEYFGATQWDRVQDVEVCENGNVYTRTESLLSLWDDDGGNVWSERGYFDDAYALENGNVLTTHSASYGIVNLTCRNNEGEQKWFSIHNIEYAQDWSDYVYISSAIDGPNETIYVLLWIYGFHPGRLLIQLDNNGNQLSNRTLSFSENLYDASNIPQYFDMYMDSYGLLYFVGENLNRDWDYSIVVSVYDFDAPMLGIPNSIIINSCIAFLLVIVVMISIESKRRISHS